MPIHYDPNKKPTYSSDAPATPGFFAKIKAKRRNERARINLAPHKTELTHAVALVGTETLKVNQKKWTGLKETDKWGEVRDTGLGKLARSLGLRRFVLLPVKDAKGAECYVRVNSNSLKQIFNISDEDFKTHLKEVGLDFSSQAKVKAVLDETIKFQEDYNYALNAVQFDGMFLGKLDGVALDQYPNFRKDPAIAKAAVTNNGLAIQFVDPSIVDEELKSIAINNNLSAIKYMDIKLDSTIKLGIDAAKAKPEQLKKAPESIQLLLVKAIVAAVPESDRVSELKKMLPHVNSQTQKDLITNYQDQYPELIAELDEDLQLEILNKTDSVLFFKHAAPSVQIQFMDAKEKTLKQSAVPFLQVASEEAQRTHVFYYSDNFEYTSVPIQLEILEEQPIQFDHASDEVRSLPEVAQRNKDFLAIRENGMLLREKEYKKYQSDPSFVKEAIDQNPSALQFAKGKKAIAVAAKWIKSYPDLLKTVPDLLQADLVRVLHRSFILHASPNVQSLLITTPETPSPSAGTPPHEEFLKFVPELMQREILEAEPKRLKYAGVRLQRSLAQESEFALLQYARDDIQKELIIETPKLFKYGREDIQIELAYRHPRVFFKFLSPETRMELIKSDSKFLKYEPQ